MQALDADHLLSPGFFDRLDWQLWHCSGSTASSTPACPLKTIVRVLDVCQQQPRLLHRWAQNRTTCMAFNRTLLGALKGRSMLMLGDSTSATTYCAGCQMAAAGWSAGDSMFLSPGSVSSSNRSYYHLSRCGTMHHCSLGVASSPQWRGRRWHRLTTEGPKLGSLVHYGVIGPPYWAAAYPLAPWLAASTREIVEQQAPLFCVAAGCKEPTMIVLNSALWDLEMLWLYDGERQRDFELRPTQVHRYLRGVRALVETTRRVFPRSRILWRTLHPAGPAQYGGKSTHPASIHALNEAVRAHAPTWRLEIVDVGRMIQGLVPAAGLLHHARASNVFGTLDGRHLLPWVDIPVLNLLLNLLATTETHE